MGIKKKHIMKALAVVLAVVFSITTVYSPSYAQTIAQMPTPGQMVSLTPSFQPALIKGLCVNPKNPFQFDFIVDIGYILNKLHPIPGIQKIPADKVKYIRRTQVPDMRRIINGRAADVHTYFIFF